MCEECDCVGNAFSGVDIETSGKFRCVSNAIVVGIPALRVTGVGFDLSSIREAIVVSVGDTGVSSRGPALLVAGENVLAVEFIRST